MATPVGHSLFGLLVAKHWGKPDNGRMLYWYAFAVFAANAADLDFVPGLFKGDINLYHQGPSHSLLAILIFSLLSVVIAKIVARVRHIQVNLPAVGLVAGLSYLTHLVLDMLSHDKREPIGIPLGWPFVEGHWTITTLLSGVRHGVPGDSIEVFLTEVFSAHNLWSISKEVLLALPFIILSVIFVRHKRMQT